jgi:hypothetical protein
MIDEWDTDLLAIDKAYGPRVTDTLHRLIDSGLVVETNLIIKYLLTKDYLHD